MQRKRLRDECWLVSIHPGVSCPVQTQTFPPSFRPSETVYTPAITADRSGGSVSVGRVEILHFRINLLSTQWAHCLPPAVREMRAERRHPAWRMVNTWKHLRREESYHTSSTLKIQLTTVGAKGTHEVVHVILIREGGPVVTRQEPVRAHLGR